MMKIRLGTRKSLLAIKQAEIVKSAILQTDSSVEVEIIGITTEGDRKKQEWDLLPKGGFVRTIEEKISSGEIDAGVHSLKDMGVNLLSGLEIKAVLKRDDPRDVLVANNGKKLAEFKSGFIVGTSSPRRSALLKHLRNDIVVKEIRGNVDTRIKKLRSGEYDGVILAAAGLERLGLLDVVTEFFDPEIFIPAAGQGVIAVETASGKSWICDLISRLNHSDTSCAVGAEREFISQIEADCDVPAGVYVEIKKEKIFIRAVILSPDGETILRGSLEGEKSDSLNVARRLAELMMKKRAREIITGSNG